MGTREILIFGQARYVLPHTYSKWDHLILRPAATAEHVAESAEMHKCALKATNMSTQLYVGDILNVAVICND